MFDWFWALFPAKVDPTAKCIACDNIYAKEAMKELWYKYVEGDGTTGTSTCYICVPCVEEVAKYVEEESTNFDDEQFEVD